VNNPEIPPTIPIPNTITMNIITLPLVLLMNSFMVLFS